MSSVRQYTFDGQPVFLLGEKGSDFVTRHGIQDFQTIRKQFFEAGKLFVDQEFPASDASLFYSKKPARNFKWLRPKEIEKDPRFFVGGHSRFDIKQGELGNCWLLAAAACLTEDTKLFYRVVCKDNSFVENYAGVFHFRFWQYGKWIDVVIDDRLPTLNGRLIYMRSNDKNEFWSALLEKAYAKLHGSYEALDAGKTSEGFQDFTGGLTESYELNDAPKNLFHILTRAFEKGSMVGCSITDATGAVEAKTEQGLVCNHAYSVTKVSLVDVKTPNKSGKIPLVRLRNPWGDDCEWNGAWSDKAREWDLVSDETKKELGLSFDHDGEFWMSFQDFLIHFHTLEICNLSAESLIEDPKSATKKKWNLLSFEGEWVEGISAGGCINNRETFYQNPQYVMNLKEVDKGEDKCSVVIALLQKHRRSRREIGLDCLPIGFSLYRLTESDLLRKRQDTEFFKSQPQAAPSPTFINIRETSRRYELEPGRYLVIPSTFDKNEEGEFLVRIFSEGRSSLKENDETVGIEDVLDPALVEAIRTSILDQYLLELLFNKAVDARKELGWWKLKLILDQTYQEELTVKNRKTGELELQGFSKDVCRSMVAMLDSDHSGRLGLKEFTILMSDIAKWNAIFKFHKPESNTIETSNLRNILASGGYRLNNHILNSLGHRYGSRDKKVSFDDFIFCAVKLKTMIDEFKSKDFGNTNQATFTLDDWIIRSLYS